MKMSHLLIFDDDIAECTKASKSLQNAIKASVAEAPPNGPPQDNFDVQVPFPEQTVFYLTITTPHIESFEVHGPARQFDIFRNKIEQLVANFPSAAKKLEDLEGKKPDVFIGGFKTFVIELGNDNYTRLDVTQEINPSVHQLLPAPVFLVTTHGPMHHEVGLVGGVVKATRRHGYATTSRLLSSFADYKVAKYHATRAMDTLLQQAEADKDRDLNVMRRHTDDSKCASMGNWMSMAMAGRYTWEVKVTMVKEINRGRTNTFNTDI